MSTARPAERKRRRLVGQAARHDPLKGPWQRRPRYPRPRPRRGATAHPARRTAYGWAVRHPVLLLTRPAQQFILGEHAADLAARGAGTIALPGRVPYGAVTRAQPPLRPLVARRIAQALMHRCPEHSAAGARRDRLPRRAVAGDSAAPAIRGVGRGVVLPLGSLRGSPGCWPARPAPGRLAHEELAAASELIFCVSGRLAELEEEQGRAALTLPTSADAFRRPAHPGCRGAEILAAHGVDRRGRRAVAVSLGHLGRRTDWAGCAGLRSTRRADAPAHRRLA